MSVHVRLVTPVTEQDPRTLESVQALQRPDLTISVVEIESGPVSIECERDEAAAIPDTVRRIVEAERDGADAVVIDCMGDPGLQQARAQVSIPVLGPAEVSFHTASMLGATFSFVTVAETIRPIFNRLARAYGVSERVASFRSIQLPVVELGDDLARLERLLCEQSLAAVRDDGADVIVLGCTGFVGVAGAIDTFLLARLGKRVPVIDPIPLTVLTAAAWVDAGVRIWRVRPAVAPAG